MARFNPQPSVLTTVKMTRTAYAQLVGQKFHPPKIWGRWQETEGTKEWRWKDIGMKLVGSLQICSFNERNDVFRLVVLKFCTKKARTVQMLPK